MSHADGGGRDRAAQERLLSGYTGRLSLVLALGWLGVKLGREALPPLLPAIIEGLAISPAQAGFGLTLMWAVYSLQQYPAGRLSDGLSRKTVLVASLGVIIAGFVVLSVVSTYPGFLAGVALVGVGGGLYFIPTRALLSDLFVEKRGRAFGLNQATGHVGSGAAAGIAVAALALGAWQAAFIPVVAVLALALVLIHAWGREPYVVRRIELGLRESGVRVFMSPRIRWYVVAYSLFSFSWQGVVGFLPTFLQAERGFSPGLAGANFALVFAVGFVATIGAGSLSDRRERAPIAAAALALAAVGISGVLLGPTAAAISAGVGLFALGLQAFPPVMQAHFMDVFPEDSMGGDFGVLKTVYTLVGSLGPTYVGLVAERASYTTAFAGLAGCLLVASAIVVWQVRS